MIHQYKLNGYNIVLDTYSGSIHTTDELGYEIIGMVDEAVQARCAADAGAQTLTESACAAQVLQDEAIRGELTERLLAKYGSSTGAEEIGECFDDVLELVRAGKLFTDDVYRDKAFDLKQRSTVIKALCLHVAHTCNLNCEYCFASQGNFQGTSGLMSFEVGKRALDFLVENSGFRRNLEVDFFGG